MSGVECNSLNKGHKGIVIPLDQGPSSLQHYDET